MRDVGKWTTVRRVENRRFDLGAAGICDAPCLVVDRTWSGPPELAYAPPSTSVEETIAMERALRCCREFGLTREELLAELRGPGLGPAQVFEVLPMKSGR